MSGLNAPFGARCFLTVTGTTGSHSSQPASLNAPYGARCFLTDRDREVRWWYGWALMHLMALGAF